MKKKRSRLTNVILIVLLLAGLSLLLYPTVSDYWNSLHQSRAIANYVETVDKLSTAEYDDILRAAREYNAALAAEDGIRVMDAERLSEYESMLNVSGTGVMGYIEIPDIDCSLPIYHGTDDTVLQVAIGHLSWSSLPVGGESSHCVVSGHRGLPSAKLFTNLDRLREGDIFMLRVLDEVYTYQVDRILTVEPDEVGNLTISEGADFCTLVTCTPYGINTHRLLVRGHRIENISKSGGIYVTAEASQIDPLIVAPFASLPLLLVLLITLFIPKRRSRGGKFDEEVQI